MTKRYVLTLFILLLGFVALFTWLLNGNNIAVLNPKGYIAAEQLDLIITAMLIMSIVIVPVFALTIYIVWKYREGNQKATYQPDWDSDGRLEAVWWGFPLLLMALLSVLIWTSSHALDPYRPIESDKKPLVVRVVALQWKWLFLYPEQNIAAVNTLWLPEDRPIHLYNMSDAPMNSLWIPQLGGQIYAMNGMVTQLHLLANETGEYRGLSANISGEGFADMHFTATVTTQTGFKDWVRSVEKAPERLSLAAYQKLAEPSKDVPPTRYGSYEKGLYQTIMAKYMAPMPEDATMQDMHMKDTH